jgi:transcriptional regulator with XRE-family HTH domain
MRYYKTMKDKIVERMIAVRKTLKLSQRTFADRLGIKRNAVSMIEVGTNTLTDQNIKLICMNFNVNEEWLRTGIGEMFVIQPNLIQLNPYEEEFFAIYRDLMPETQQSLFNLAKQLLETQKKLSAKADTSA